MAKCKHQEKCDERFALELFARVGGRTLGALPDCKNCNMFEEVE